MPTGVVFSQRIYKKEEVREQLDTNIQILDLIEEVVDKINLPSLSVYIRESLTKLFNEYDYLKNNVNKLNTITILKDKIGIELNEKENKELFVFICFTLTDINNIVIPSFYKVNKTTILNDKIEIRIGEYIAISDGINKYAIYLSISDLINHESN